MKLIKTLGGIANRYRLLADGTLTLFIAALAFFSLRELWALQPPVVHPLVAVTLVTLEIVPLAWRRVFPSATLMVITAAAVATQLLNISEMGFLVIAAIIAIFSAAAYGGPRRNLACGICVAAIVGSISYKLMFSGTAVFPISRILFLVTNFLSNLLVFVPIWWFGNILRLSREQTLLLGERTKELSREREENARRAVFDERVRIARELHDVLAHHVSVMGIQAGAARQVLTQYPEKALNSLSLIEASSRQAVAELYRLLGLLRDERQVDTFTSQPGLDQLDRLVADMQTSGLRVEVIVKGEKREVPQAVDLSAYRIVEEALTNSLKHAGPAKATVILGYQKDALILDVADNGKGSADTGDQKPSGRGLIGMRERVRLLKGEFRAGNRPGGGFVVNVRLPLGEQGR